MPVHPDSAGMSFNHGELSASVSRDMFQTVRAVRDASYRLQLAPVKEGGTEVGASVVAYDPHGTEVVIKLFPDGMGGTQIRIRAGVLGDEGYSRRILTEIIKHLP